MKFKQKLTNTLTASAFALMANSALAAPIDIEVIVTSNVPAGGVAITPLWVGFHNGSFDSYDGGAEAASSLEALAELGMTGPISDVFAGTLVGDPIDGRVQGAIADGGPIFAGGSPSAIFTLDDGGANNYFSYAAMILPSNDFFIANGNPLAHDVSDLLDGTVTTLSFDVGLPGTVNDAGTEVNDFAFSPNPPPFGIPAGDAPGGADENGVITNVVGDPFAAFLNQPGGDLSVLNFNNAALYPNGVATITFNVVPAPVPVPAALPLAASAFGGLFAFMRRRRT
ncbi:MAG: spondin domain-containing protein [Pseudomonadota bacterium]